jgi:hypothetical protein
MKMKKVVLSLAGVMAAAAFAPEASAVPVFARQTGMACSACHFAHFPLLNPFGRSFKASGYTLMGAQGKVEGEDLSIPDRLNMAMLATAGHQSQGTANGTAAAAGDNGWFVPGAGGELQLFIGGKVSEYSGFLSEFGIGNATVVNTGAGATAAATPAIKAASGKLLLLPEVAEGIHAGLVIYQIGQDAAGSFELLNTGATSIHRLMGNTGAARQHINATSARQFVVAEGGATGISGVVVSDKYFVNISRYAPVDTNSGVNSAANLPGQYVRAAAFFDLVGFDSAVGIQSWSGRIDSTSNLGVLQLGEEKATALDFQMQGEVGGKTLGFYASWAKAPKGTAGGQANRFNASTAHDKSSFNLAVDYTVMPKVTLQAAYRNGTVPNAVGASTQTQKDNAFMLGAAYELAQNQHLSIHYTAQSGSAYDATTGVNKAVTGKTNTTVLLESFF